MRMLSSSKKKKKTLRNPKNPSSLSLSQPNQNTNPAVGFVTLWPQDKLYGGSMVLDN